MDQTQDPLAWDHFKHVTHYLNKLGKGPKAMLHTQFQAPGPSDSEEEDFLLFFMFFYDSNPGPPAKGLFKTKDHHLNKLGKEALGLARYKSSST